MLTIDNIRQIIEEQEVFDREPEATNQGLDVVLFAIGEERARLGDRLPRLDDGIFAAWAICFPFMPQSPAYSALMRARRSEWFADTFGHWLEERARAFFTPELLELQLNQLGDLVNAPDADERIQAYLGDLPPESASAPEDDLLV